MRDQLAIPIATRHHGGIARSPTHPIAGAGLRYGEAAGTWVLLATVVGSSMAWLDGTVVNIALPVIGRRFHASLTTLQWVVNAYALALAGLLLLGGALGDRYGRRRIFVVGVIWFAFGSAACGLAPSAPALVGARALQGIGAALLTPGSLAIIEASFEPRSRSAAVGAWSGLGGVATAAGPLIGGWLVTAVSWRLVFFINLPLAVLVVWVALRHVPESRDERASEARMDLPGAVLAACALAGVTYALTRMQSAGASAATLVPGLAGVAAFAGFVARQRLAAHPMVPLGLFASRQFSAANAATLLIYAALSAVLFLLPIELQQAAGYSALQAGLAVIPMTAIMLALSARAGRLAARVGPRLPMTVGPLLAGGGIALLTRVGPHASYLVDLLPAVATLGLGMALTVAPLTATVLTAGGERHAGISSAVNNDVARTAGLLAVAVIPTAVGLSGAAYMHAATLTSGYRTAAVLCAALAAAGGALSWLTISSRPETGGEVRSCPLGAPPLLAGRDPATS